MTTTQFKTHTHEALDHDHDHIHITHHAKSGNNSQIEHLMATHNHSHNHLGLQHSHLPHEDSMKSTSMRRI